ncbi:MAG: hypothetical protein KatS3mg003_0287 [Candidatus Nitrosocaldaceae archaeon]|nr:MAG: hypothetical protein KatS3mg003_0287 [Candidatus Nitrosocaldaceae archaeon]
MKAKYDRDEDVLLLELSNGKIDHAEEYDNMIIHFTKDKKPVLMRY